MAAKRSQILGATLWQTGAAFGVATTVVTKETVRDAIATAFHANPALPRVPLAQPEQTAASLAGIAASTSRAAQLYFTMQAGLGLQNDTVQVLGLLLAYTAASSSANKAKAEELLPQIVEIASQATWRNLRFAQDATASPGQ